MAWAVRAFVSIWWPCQVFDLSMKKKLRDRLLINKAFALLNLGTKKILRLVFISKQSDGKCYEIHADRSIYASHLASSILRWIHHYQRMPAWLAEAIGFNIHWLAQSLSILRFYLSSADFTSMFQFADYWYMYNYYTYCRRSSRRYKAVLNMKVTIETELVIVDHGASDIMRLLVERGESWLLQSGRHRLQCMQSGRCPTNRSI